MISTHTGV